MGVFGSIRDFTPGVIAVVKSAAPHLLLFHCGLARRFLCCHCTGFRVRKLLVPAAPVGLNCVLLFFFYCKICRVRGGAVGRGTSL